MTEYRFSIKGRMRRWLNRHLATQLFESYIRTDAHGVAYYFYTDQQHAKSRHIDWQNMVDVYCFGRHLSLQFAVPAKSGYQLEEVLLELTYLETLPEKLELELQQQWQLHVDIESVRQRFNNVQAGMPFAERQFVARS